MVVWIIFGTAVWDSSERIWFRSYLYGLNFHSGSAVKNLPATQEPLEMWVWSLGWEDPLEESMATHSSIPAWIIPWTEELGKLHSTVSKRVGHDWSDRVHMSTLSILVVFPNLFNLILSFGGRSSWLEPQSAPGLVFANCISFSTFSCKEYNQSDFSVDHLVMSMCRIISCVVGRGCFLWPVCSLGKTLLAFVLLHFVLQVQTCFLFQVSLDFLILHSNHLWWKAHLFLVFWKVLELFTESFNFSFFSVSCWGIDLDYCAVERFA